LEKKRDNKPSYKIEFTLGKFLLAAAADVVVVVNIAGVALK
jgi:hypothetical protein